MEDHNYVIDTCWMYRHATYRLTAVQDDTVTLVLVAYDCVPQTTKEDLLFSGRPLPLPDFNRLVDQNRFKPVEWVAPVAKEKKKRKGKA